MASASKADPTLLWLLDTNIVSELCRPSASPSVLERFTTHEHAVAIAAAVWHELLFGVLRLPEGRRKTELRQFVLSVAGSLPKLVYDENAARIHAELRIACASQGRVLSEPDAHIAAVAIANGLTLVTRNTRDYEGIPGLQLADWFQS